MITEGFFKTVDFVVFSSLAYLASLYYVNDYMAFEIINAISMIYVASRKPDINTITLIFILMTGHLIAIALNYPVDISGYQTHGILVVLNATLVALAALRPVFLSKYGPKFIIENKNLILTHQDMIMTGLLTLQTVWQLCQLFEHLIRNRHDIGLGGLFGNWSPMLFYDTYKTGQFGFSILMLIVLYMMTFDKSKTKPKAKLIV